MEFINIDGPKNKIQIIHKFLSQCFLILIGCIQNQKFYFHSPCINSMGCFSFKPGDLDGLEPSDLLLCTNSAEEMAVAIMNSTYIQYFTNFLKHLFKTEKQKKQINKDSNFKLPISEHATDDRKQYQIYTDIINKSLKQNPLSTTNILDYMIAQTGSYKDQDRIYGNINGNQQFAALKCFVYLYTGKYAYKNIKRMLNKRDYDKISGIIAIVMKQLKQYNQRQNTQRTLKAKAQGQIVSIFRGIPEPDRTMISGAKIYWRSFASTSLKTDKANKFGKFIYNIKLNTKNPHPYLIVPKQWSQFDQEEIILFPFFYFQCTDNKAGNNGGVYFIEQKTPPEEPLNKKK